MAGPGVALPGQHHINAAGLHLGDDDRLGAADLDLRPGPDGGHHGQGGPVGCGQSGKLARWYGQGFAGPGHVVPAAHIHPAVHLLLPHITGQVKARPQAVQGQITARRGDGIPAASPVASHHPPAPTAGGTGH